MRLLLSSLFILFFGSFAFAQDLSIQEVKQLLLGNANNETSNFLISSAYKDEVTGNKYIYVQQTHQNIKVYNGVRNFVFNAQNQLAYTTSNFILGIEYKAAHAVPSITMEQALKQALKHVEIEYIAADWSINQNKFINPKLLKRTAEAELFWNTTDDGKTVQLVWNINLYLKKTNDWWNIRIDAHKNAFVDKDNWVVKCNFNTCKNNGVHSHNNKSNLLTKKLLAPPPTVTSANYRVVPFPVESPNHGALAIENNPWLKAGAGNNAITHQWHFDGFTNYNITRGNNVFAYEDTADLDAPGQADTSSTAIPNLNFIASPNFTASPYHRTNQRFNTTNLFYWNNIIHDVFYQHGFTEAAGNFQNDNIGRGGAGNDYVLAEAQDGSGTNNANFGTPPDGSSGTMQMYLWSPVGGITIAAPSSIAGNYVAVESNLSTNNKLQNLGSRSGQAVLFNDDASGTSNFACGGSPVNEITGKIALITRGGCPFTQKIKEAQNAGAIGVIMINNVSGSPITMGGTDNSITIPAVMVSDVDGALITTQLNASQVINVTLNAGVELDGDVDNGIIVHEYGHGISNRLTGGRTNASCLNNAEQGGEGWSDYMGLMLTQNWATTTLSDKAKPRGVGTYAIGEPTNGEGIRAYPYCTDMSVNPLTYGDVGGTSTQVHFIGTVWCTVLWDMTWNMIDMDGINPNIYNATGTGGNVRALRLVTEGMRIQTCRPGFLDARDAILVADSILYNGRYKCAIWKAFARRGFGFSATQGSSGSATDQSIAFDVPTGVRLNKEIVTRAVGQNKQITLNLSATCMCEPNQNNIKLVDTIPAGFTHVSNVGGGTVIGNRIEFNNLNFANELETKNFSITLQAGTGCAIDTAVNDNREASTKGNLTSGIITGTTGWATSNVQSSSGASSWFGTSASTSSNTTLTSGAFTARNLSVLQFRHSHDFENKLDAGVVEISSNNGSTWSTANPYFVIGGYNNTVAGNGFNGNAFTGVNGRRFGTSILNINGFNNNANMRFRFRLQTNSTNASNASYSGWFIDDILQMNGCGGVNKTQLFNSSNVLIDEVALPIFIGPESLPLQLVQFNAVQVSKNVQLHWLTNNEVNTSLFSIEKSEDGKNFKAIGEVKAANTTKENKYQFIDEKFEQPIAYYRLKMIDINGAFTYSNTRLVQKNGKEVFAVYPNPAKDLVQISLPLQNSKSTVRIINTQGQQVWQQALPAQTKYTSVQVANFSKGLYLVQVVFENGVSYQTKLVVGE